MFFRVLCLFFTAFASPLFACITYAPMVLGDVFQADAVVTGYVSHYEVVDVGAVGPLPNYARFTLRVTNVLAGDISEKTEENGHLVFTWDNSTFGEPEEFDQSREFLFALRAPLSPDLPLRGPSATFLPNREPEKFTLLQAHCSGAFFFGVKSPTGLAIQQVLEMDRDQGVNREVLEDILNGLRERKYKKSTRDSGLN